MEGKASLFSAESLVSLLSTILTVPLGINRPLPRWLANLEPWIKGANGEITLAAFYLLLASLVPGPMRHLWRLRWIFQIREAELKLLSLEHSPLRDLQQLCGNRQTVVISQTAGSAPAPISSGCLHACLHPPKSNLICMCWRWPVSTTGWTKGAFLLM